MPATLTSANAVLKMTAEALYTSAVSISGFATDDAWDPDAVQNGEYAMGVDGTLSAGFVFNEIHLSITVQADSPSLVYYENIWNYEVTNRTKLQLAQTIRSVANGRNYDYKQGYMVSYKAPAGKKILQPAVVQMVFSRLEITAI
jgi:hypothetical protein